MVRDKIPMGTRGVYSPETGHYEVAPAPERRGAPGEVTVHAGTFDVGGRSVTITAEEARAANVALSEGRSAVVGTDGVEVSVSAPERAPARTAREIILESRRTGEDVRRVVARDPQAREVERRLGEERFVEIREKRKPVVGTFVQDTSRYPTLDWARHVYPEPPSRIVDLKTKEDYWKENVPMAFKPGAYGMSTAQRTIKLSEVGEGKNFFEKVGEEVKEKGGVVPYTWAFTEPARGLVSGYFKGGGKTVIKGAEVTSYASQFGISYLKGDVSLLNIKKEDLTVEKTAGVITKVERKLKVKEHFLDPDVQTFNIITGLATLGAVSPVIAGAITIGRMGGGVYYGGKFFKSGKAEHAGTAALFFAPEFLKVVPKVRGFKVPTKTEKGVLEFKTKGGLATETKISWLTRKLGLRKVGAPPTRLGLEYKTPPVVAPAPPPSATLYRGISWELGSRAFPIVGLADKSLVFGTPTVSLEKLGGGVAFETATERAILEKALPEFQREQLRGGVRILRGTSRTRSKFLQQELIRQTRTLTPKGVEEVIKFAKREKGEIFGSFAQQPQLPLESRRLPGDIDLQLRYSPARTELKAQELLLKLKGMGENVRIRPEQPTLIEVQEGGLWHHAIDIKSIEGSEITDYETVGEKFWGFPLVQKPIRIEGVKVSKLSREAVAKGASIFVLRPEAGKLVFGPKAHRVKDIADYFRIEEALIESKWFGKPRLRAELEKLKLTFPKEAFEEAGKPGKIRIPISEERPSSAGAYYLGSLAYAAPSYALPSPSVQPSPYVSPAVYPSVSVKPSVSVSSYVSPSRYYKYPSVSAPPSVSISPPSVSRYPSRYVSPSVSRYVSPSPYVSPSLKPSVSVSPSLVPKSFTSWISPPSPYRKPSRKPSVSRRMRRGYDVLLKRTLKKVRGKRRSRGYTKINRKPLSRDAATGLGMRTADFYANRSFKLKRAKGAVVNRPSLERVKTLLQHKFRKAKKNRNVFVEKTSFAIDSPMEKKSIPYESLRLRRLGLLRKSRSRSQWLLKDGNVKHEKKRRKKLKWL